MRAHTERSLTVEQALSIAEVTMHDLGLQSKSEAYGNELQTYRCQIIELEKRSIFYGFGKGLGLQSKASACYEALEHFAVHRFARKLAEDESTYQKLTEYPVELPCVALTEYKDQSTLTLPLFAIDPRYAKNPSHKDSMNYQAYSAYVSDTGVASGANFIEASIHAINELIERDAHSLFLIEAFIKQKNIKSINKETLPMYLKSIVNKIETQYHDNVMLFDITTEFGISVMYASMTQQPFLIQPSGCGASLSAEYALERALLEMLQPLHIHNAKLADNQQQIVDVLKPYPLLLRAAIADVSNIKCEAINWQDKPVIKFDSLQDQLDHLNKLINHQGFKLYHLTVMQHASGFTTVKYHIPDLESFHLVQTGKKILPGKRGHALLSA